MTKSVDFIKVFLQKLFYKFAFYKNHFMEILILKSERKAQSVKEKKVGTPTISIYKKRYGLPQAICNGKVFAFERDYFTFGQDNPCKKMDEDAIGSYWAEPFKPSRSVRPHRFFPHLAHREKLFLTPHFPRFL